MEFEKMTLCEYEDALASKKSTPGGGSALALVLLNAISLCQMVYNFTVDKKGYEGVREEFISLNKKLEEAKPQAYFILNEDSESFIKLMDAYKSKDEEKIALASINACEVPYKLYQITKEIEIISKIMVDKGNINVVSDAKIANDLCLSIYNGCKLNIRANIKCIKNKDLLDKYLSIM